MMLQYAQAAYELCWARIPCAPSAQDRNSKVVYTYAIIVRAADT